jgi:hypothetical protein
MRFPCNPVDSTFFDIAPMRFKTEIELAARPADVFAIFEDGDSWPRWFCGIRTVVWTSNKPYSVGTTRTVWLTGVTIDELFFRWEPDRRFSFYLTGHSMPLFHAFAEDYLLEELAPGVTRFIYSVAIEPALALRIGGPVARRYFDSMFANACKGLQSYILTRGPRHARGG